MLQDEQSLLEGLKRSLDAISEGRTASTLEVLSTVSVEVRAMAEAANRVIENLCVLRQFSIALANGQINFSPPSNLHLLDPLKSLQASLRHLTWQAQEVAAGNLEHKRSEEHTSELRHL